MAQPKTFVLDSDQTFLNLEKLANDKAEKLFRFRKLEKYEKVCIAKLKGTIRLQHDKICQYAHVKIVENSLARPVILW